MKMMKIKKNLTMRKEYNKIHNILLHKKIT
jgi:hypothetical protein